MFRDLENRLRNGVKGPLRDNGYAKGLLYLLENNAELPDYDRLMAINPSIQREVDLDTVEEDKGITDLRLLALYVQGVRKFPTADAWYYINFFNHGTSPVSSVFLGCNGVGKSTLYSSIEYCCLGRSNLAEERGYGEKQSLYMTHNNIASENARISLYTKSQQRNITIADHVAPLVPPAYFCSEYDILQISTNGLASKYISRQLGLERYHDLIMRMTKAFKRYDEVEDEYKKISKEIQGMEREIHIMQFVVSNSDALLTKVWNIFKNISLNSISLPEGTVIISNAYITRLNKLIKNIDILRELLKYNETAQTALGDTYDIITELRIPLNTYKELRKEFPQPTEKLVCVLRQLSDYINALIDQCQKWIKHLKSILNSEDGPQNIRRHNFIDKMQEIERLLVSNTKKVEEERKYAPLLKWSEDNLAKYKETLAYLKQGYREILTEYAGLVDAKLNELLSIYFEKDIERVRAYVSEDGMFINVDIDSRSPVDGKITEKVEPRRFLNTFRFKMFCFVFKFSLVCCVKKLKGVNFPFVIDDVFDSSDFDNRSEIAHLIKTLCDAHDKMYDSVLPPLQLIFFTQDSVIAESIAFNGFYVDDVKFSRLYNYYEAVESDTTTGSEGQRLIKVEERI